MSEAKAFIIYEAGVIVGNFEIYPYKSELDAIQNSRSWWGNWMAFKYDFSEDFDLKHPSSIVNLLGQKKSKDAREIKSYVSDRGYIEMEAANFL